VEDAGREGPPVVNVNGPRYGAIWGAGPPAAGLNNIELITDRPLEVNLQEIKQVKREVADRALVVSLMVPCDEDSAGRTSCRSRGHRRRRGRTELRLPAWHERTRHGLGRRPGAGIYRDGHALGASKHAHAGAS
jgi:hypothetical protein